MKPLTPKNCDLRDFPRMMLDITHLRSSEFDTTLDDAAWRAGVNLWMSSWHQVPAASLQNGDASLAKAAGLGRDMRSWKKVRAVAMRGWIECDDGLLYHPVIAELALECWIEKLGNRLSSGAGNAKRYETTFDPAPIYDEIRDAAALLKAISPKSRSLAKQHVHKAVKVLPAGLPVGGDQEPKSVPVRSQGKGREGKDRRVITPHSVIDPSISTDDAARHEGATTPMLRVVEKEPLEVRKAVVASLGRGLPKIVHTPPSETASQMAERLRKAMA
jgi:hypothetical protein